MILNRKLATLARRSIFWNKGLVGSGQRVSVCFSDLGKTNLEKISKGGKGLDSIIP